MLDTVSQACISRNAHYVVWCKLYFIILILQFLDVEYIYSSCNNNIYTIAEFITQRMTNACISEFITIAIMFCRFMILVVSDTKQSSFLRFYRITSQTQYIYKFKTPCARIYQLLAQIRLFQSGIFLMLNYILF